MLVAQRTFVMIIYTKWLKTLDYGFLKMIKSYDFILVGFEMYLLVSLATAIKLFRYWFSSQMIKNELENKNLESELALLRSQINPHFLFNTLNNINSLAYKNPDLVTDSIVKLSEIMRRRPRAKMATIGMTGCFFLLSFSILNQSLFNPFRLFRIDIHRNSDPWGIKIP